MKLATRVNLENIIACMRIQYRSVRSFTDKNRYKIIDKNKNIK